MGKYCLQYWTKIGKLWTFFKKTKRIYSPNILMDTLKLQKTTTRDSEQKLRYSVISEKVPRRFHIVYIQDHLFIFKITSAIPQSEIESIFKQNGEWQLSQIWFPQQHCKNIPELNLKLSKKHVRESQYLNSRALLAIVIMKRKLNILAIMQIKLNGPIALIPSVTCPFYNWTSTALYWDFLGKASASVRSKYENELNARFTVSWSSISHSLDKDNYLIDFLVTVLHHLQIQTFQVWDLIAFLKTKSILTPATHLDVFGNVKKLTVAQDVHLSIHENPRNFQAILFLLCWQVDKDLLLQYI